MDLDGSLPSNRTRTMGDYNPTQLRLGRGEWACATSNVSVGLVTVSAAIMSRRFTPWYFSSGMFFVLLVTAETLSLQYKSQI